MTDAENPNVIKRTSGMAIASLIMSSLSIVLGPLGFVPGILLGYIARAECRRDPNTKGDGLAVAGMVVGYVFVGLFVLAIIVFSLITSRKDVT